MSKDFKRKDLHKKKRLNDSWRKPRGIQNKRRLKHKGHAKTVRPGFGTKDQERHTLKGLQIIQISTLEQLKSADPKKHAIIIAGVGAKKKLLLIAEAEKLKLTLVNLNVKKYKETVEAKKKEKQDKAKARTKKLESKKTTKTEKPAEKTEKKEPELSEEEKKEQEKQEKDKLLTKSK